MWHLLGLGLKGLREVSWHDQEGKKQQKRQATITG
jgi:hypothetical protein